MNQNSQFTIHNVGYAFDLNYYDQFCVSIASLFQNNNPKIIHLHCICTGLTEVDVLEVLKYVEDCGSKITFYDPGLLEVIHLKLTSEWSSAVYLRLLFPDVLPASISTLLYLDTDTLIIGRLDELFSLCLGDLPLAAVYDNYVRTQPLIGIQKESCYFNSGVMLLNLEVWRKENLGLKVIDYVYKHPDRILYVDQCGINAVLLGRWHRLSEKYNFLTSYIHSEMSRTDHNNSLNDKSILHFTLRRPWIFPSLHPYSYLYKKYHRLSVVKKNCIYKKINYRNIKTLSVYWFLSICNNVTYVKQLLKKNKSILD